MTVKKQYSSFQDVIDNAETPILVNFYATWCENSRNLVSILDQVKANMGDQIQVVRIDAEKYRKLAAQYEVTAYPTMLVFVKGELASRIRGVMKYSDLMQHLQKFVQEMAVK